MAPAVSKKQRITAAIAEKYPKKLYARNKAMAEMSQSQLHDFASTPEKGLPMKKRQKKMMDKSTMGSPSLSGDEMMKGYRSLR